MKKYLPYIFLCIVVLYFLLLIHQAVLGTLTGTFQKHVIPDGDKKLAAFLESQNTFSRTLWVPTIEKFGYTSDTHPAVSAYDFFHVASTSGVIDFLHKKDTQQLLENSSIQYLVVPFDSEKSIYLKDNRYNDTIYKITLGGVEKLSWLQPLRGFDNMFVFRVTHPKEHVWLANDTTGKVIYKQLSETAYSISLENIKKGDELIFTDSYSSQWQLQTKTNSFSAKLFQDRENMFIVPFSGTYAAMLVYAPQQWVGYGLWISTITLIILIVLILIIQIKFIK